MILHTFMTHYRYSTIQTRNCRKEAGYIITGNHGETEEDTLLTKPKVRTEPPSFYRVVLLNDDYTPMDFVVKVLENIFHKDHNEAARLMMQVHQKGSAVCGVFTKDVAETKIDQTLYLAQQHEHPLQCVMEQE